MQNTKKYAILLRKNKFSKMGESDSPKPFIRNIPIIIKDFVQNLMRRQWIKIVFSG